MVDLGKETVVRGLRYTPRQDMNRGRIERYRLELSKDGKIWHAMGGERRFDDGNTARVIEFEKPVRTRYLGLTALSDHGRANHAAIAEIEPLTVDSPDVRDLGIIPGFND
jgi:beta-galactosidase